MATIGKDVGYARQLLEQGELVAIPTETVYGLAGNALNQEAVVKIFSVKNRPAFDPVIVHVASLGNAVALVDSIPKQAEELAKRFWPGPLTLLLKKKHIVPDLVTAGMERVGIRCPAHPLTLSLLDQLPFPLAAPSANPFGYISPTTAVHVDDQLGTQIQYILDGGSCEVGIESTIVGWDRGVTVIYRLGGITREQIESTVGIVSLAAHQDTMPQAPGQLKSHYAPTKKLILGNVVALAQENSGNKIGTLTFQATGEFHAEVRCVLSPSGDMNEAARNLFSMMRLLDQSNIDLVIAEEVPETGLGRAINDRLRRAAAG